jgi:hypothetical protein
MAEQNTPALFATEPREERIRKARLWRLRELLMQARAEHCFDHEDLDADADSSLADVDALMHAFETMSVQRRAGVRVSIGDSLGPALRDRSEVNRAHTEAREAEALAQEAEQRATEATQALERERSAHRATAEMLTAAQDELAAAKKS